jgi:large subunit ribosomal protein L10
MNREEKKALVADFQSRFAKAKGAFLVDYQGLNVEAMNRLRRELRDVDAEFQVVKNRLMKLACKETPVASLESQMIGPSAVALTYDDVISSAKVLANLSKEFKQLQIKVGQISGKVIDAEAIKRLAELPGRDALLAQVLSAMQGVPASFVRVLNGLIVQLLNVLKAIQEQKTD